MTNEVKGLLIFLGGVGTGVFGAYRFLKKKFYEDFDNKVNEKVNEEVDKRIQDMCSEDVKSMETIVETIKEAYKPENVNAFIDSLGYSSVNDQIPQRKEDVHMTSSSNGPDVYIIAPEEFEEEAEYDSQFFTLYSDGVLVDDNNEEVEDPEKILGENWIDYLEEASSVYFRNDDIQVDFEVVRDLHSYNEINGSVDSSDGN